MVSSFGSSFHLYFFGFLGVLTIALLIVLMARQSKQAGILEKLSESYQTLCNEMRVVRGPSAIPQNSGIAVQASSGGTPSIEALERNRGLASTACMTPVASAPVNVPVSAPAAPVAVAPTPVSSALPTAFARVTASADAPAAPPFAQNSAADSFRRVIVGKQNHAPRPAGEPMAPVAPATPMAPVAPPNAQSAAFGSLPQTSNDNSQFRMENWIGRNAIGVLASVLVFLGLVFLGATFIPQLSDVAKVALMFSLSGVLTIGGSALAVARKNGFTTALMGCGVGSLFISVLVTHIYFGMLGEVAAYALILAWMMLCLALVRKTQSLLLAIVLQIGLAISICLGYVSSMTDGRLALLLGYQLAASVIVVGGNMLFYRRMYHSSLVLAIALSIVASSFLWGYVAMPGHAGLPMYGWGFVEWNDWVSQPIGLIMAACALQLATSTALAILLVRSLCAAIMRQSGEQLVGEQQVEERHTIGQQAAGYQGAGQQVEGRPSQLFVALAFLWLAVLRIDVFAAAEFCASWSLHAASAVGLSNLECEYYAAFIASVVLFALAVASMVAFLAYARKQGLSMSEQPIRGSVIAYLVCGAYITAAPTLLAVFATSALRLATLWMWAVAAFVIGRITQGKRYYVIALAFIALDAFFYGWIGFATMETAIGQLGAIAFGGVVVAGLCGFAGVILHALKPASPGVVGLAAASTLLVMSYLYHCTPLAAEGYQWSLCCMMCALTCIVFGFRMRIGGLRLYGLVLVIACVAKLALLDISALDSLARVGAFIAGGVICFAISALYNFAVKRFAAGANE